MPQDIKGKKYISAEKLVNRRKPSVRRPIKKRVTTKPEKKFPDFDGNNKITQRDILIGKGVVKAKKGGSVKKKAVKKAFKPHMMYDKKTGKGVKAPTMAKHLALKKKGYGHTKPRKK